MMTGRETVPAGRGRDAAIRSAAGPFVVGFDGSPGSRAALEWAADGARRNRRQVRLVNAIHPSIPGAGVGLVPVGPLLLSVGSDQTQADFQTTVDASWQVVQDAVRRTRRSLPELDVVGDAIIGEMEHVLGEAAGADGVLVLGDRPAGYSMGDHLHPACERLLAHARTVVLVVRGTTRPGPANPVVLGLDWYDPSSAAIRFACDAAADWNAPLVVVSALTSEPAAAPVGFGSDPERAPLSTRPDLGLAGRVTAAVRSAFVDAGGSSDDVRIVIEAGASATAILRQAADAGLIVVGSRGRRPLRSLLFGSVGHDVLHRSACSVAVAHDR